MEELHNKQLEELECRKRNYCERIVAGTIRAGM